jgi:hypothetical protein
MSATAAAALRLSVERAREAGRTWQELGDVLGVSRQAAFQRFGHPVDPRTGQLKGRVVYDKQGKVARLFVLPPGSL